MELLPLVLLLVAHLASQESVEHIDRETLEALTEDIREEIEDLRQERFRRPVEVAVADAEEFRRYAVERLEKTQSPEETAADEVVAKLLGVIPADMDLAGTFLSLVEEQVGGFYDPETESFRLMESFTGPLAKVILAHELTHALDDQLYDIDGTLERLGDDSDRETAYHAVVEGSGTAVMNAWSLRHLNELRGADLSKAAMPTGPATRSAPPWIWRPLLAVYLQGAAFLNRTESLLEGQSKLPAVEDFRRAFTDPPASTEQILHPSKYWEANEREGPIEVAFEVGELPEGWDVLRQDTLGELGIMSWVEPPARRAGLPTSPLALLGVRFTSPAAEGWGGDRLVLLGSGDARVLVVRTRWDTEWDAGEFHAALGALEPQLRASVKEVAKAHGLRSSGVEIEASRGELAVTYKAWMTRRKTEARLVLEAVHPRP